MAKTVYIINAKQEKTPHQDLDSRAVLVIIRLIL